MKRLISKSVFPLWIEYLSKWGHCSKCPLHTSRTNVVLFRGRLPAKLLFIGEAPGYTEDDIGSPFIGDAGILLDELLEGIQETTALTNIVACIPCQDQIIREPTRQEVNACSQRLQEFLDICTPKKIVLLGNITKRYAPAFSVPSLTLPHPAYILRLTGTKKILEVKRFSSKLKHFLRSNANT